MRRLGDLFGGARPAGNMGSIDFIVAGLGNPGREYENTRHNAGFLALDALQKELGFDMKRLRFQSLCGDAVLGGKRVLFLKPSTYMNKSGEAVRDAMQFYRVPPERTLILFDDINLDPGKLRVRRGGSDGGQKGMQNIICLTGSDAFPRVRIGIGKKPHADMELADWVLSRFSKEDLKLLEPALQHAAEAARMIVQGDIAEAMNRFNG